MNNIPVEEAVKEFQDEFLPFTKEVSKNHGEAYDPDILSSDYLAYKEFSGTSMFSDIIAL